MESLKLVLNIVSCLLAVGYAVLFLLWRKGWNRIPEIHLNPDFVPQTSISVLIAARNEEVLLPETLNAIINQNYPQHLLEIIVIDDHSTDKTADVVESFQERGIKLISLKGFEGLNSYKKLAIQHGIDAAHGNLIVCTDADCVMGPNWLSSIAQCYEEFGWNMISAPVAYFREKSWFEKAQALEFTLLNAIGASNFGLSKVGSCNGANLAYERKAFFAVGGFKDIDHLASGDDELLLHKMSAHFPGKQGYLKHQEAMVYTYAKATWQDFIQQRIRWASKSIIYKASWMKYSSIGIWLFNLSLCLTFLAGLIFFDCELLLLFMGLFGLKLCVETIFIISPLNFFKRLKLLLLEPLLSFFHIFYLVYIGLAGNNTVYQWKGRTVK